MSEFVHNGVRIHYIVKGEGKPMIFLHGLGGSIQQTEGTFQAMDGIKSVFVDLRCHGESGDGDPSQLSYETFVEDVFALANHIGIGRFSLGGISMGAAITIKAALMYPEKLERIIPVRVAIDETGGSEERVISWYDCLANYLERHDLESFLQTEIYRRILHDAPTTAETFRRLFSEDKSLQCPWKYRIIPKLRLLRSFQELERITVPAMILANHMDLVHAYEYSVKFHKHMPGSLLFEVPSKAIAPEAHCICVTKHINGFLNGCLD